MLFALFFVLWRVSQIIILIPMVGMLAWFVDRFQTENFLTPNYILIIFIVSVLALAWATFTVFSYHRSSANATFVALVDIGFVGAFIAAVYFLRHITRADCARTTRDGDWSFYFGGALAVANIDITVSKPCAMLKATFAFGIMNIIFFRHRHPRLDARRPKLREEGAPSVPLAQAIAL
ncbi:unnamed protein product [Parascedosporium putredinis]|uniref:MARVEL domain-containing protein n=1 Tax=Parascedosporium putredinis TaxID=1442378 RepID=A0A9P1MDC3_9PEZI|nr:unnamed protein product [Parascedosporium putredinis]CAI8003355.1 unnamed protein product [Parascedosporium putredinis]